MQTNKENLIVKKTFEFAIQIVEFVELLMEHKKFPLANQLFRSGTSIGANAREAQNAESKIDFIHKMKIAAKEADETEYWLLLCKNNPNYPNPDNLLLQIDSINKILSKIISSSKSKN
ncbi:MAG: four helix bundle protein [Bacteroidia bacterium]